MANSIKYNTGTEANALRVGNFHMGVGDVSKGPTSTTGYHSGINPPPGGYTIYVHNKNIGPSIQRAFNDAELIRITNTIASTSYTTVDECLNYFFGEVDKMVVHQPMDFIVTEGLEFYADFNSVSSYPKSGQYLNSLSNNSREGLLTNSPTFNSLGYAEFDGTDDYIHVTPSLNLTNTSFTVEALIKWDGVYTQTFFGHTETFQNNKSIHWRIYDTGMLRFDFYGDSININDAVQANTWCHLLVSYDYSTDTLKAYKNGEFLAQNSSGPYIGDAGNSNTYLGTWTPNNQRLAGEIQMFRQYSNPLASAEIKQNYFKSPIITDGLVLAVDAGNLVSYDGSSTTTYSLTGSLSGSLTNGTGYSSDNGGVFTFDGNNDRIDNFSENIEPSAITIEYWKKWTVVSDDWLIGNQTSNPIDNNNGFYHRIDNPSYNFIARFGVGTTHRSVSYNPIVLNEWTHVATTFNSSEGAKLYWNGVLVNSNTNGGTLSYSNVLGLEIGGANDGSRDTPGPVGPVRIYDRALTAEEIMQNYSAGKGRFGA